MLAISLKNFILLELFVLQENIATQYSSDCTACVTKAKKIRKLSNRLVDLRSRNAAMVRKNRRLQYKISMFNFYLGKCIVLPVRISCGLCFFNFLTCNAI